MKRITDTIRKPAVLALTIVLYIVSIAATPMQVFGSATEPTITTQSSPTNTMGTWTRCEFLARYAPHGGENALPFHYDGRLYTAEDFFDNYYGLTFTNTGRLSRNNPSFFRARDVELVANAELPPTPSHLDTRSANILPDRRLTEHELNAWVYEYHALGGANTFELEVVKLINEVRVEHGLYPLAISPNLMLAARFHSQEMVDHNYFAHRSAIYGRATDRAEMFGHENEREGVYGVRENIGSGHATPQSVVNSWLNSPSHRAAVLGERYVSVGVGRVRNATTANFGS
jgi:uncharacterized protein YkwD